MQKKVKCPQCGDNIIWPVRTESLGIVYCGITCAREAFQKTAIEPPEEIENLFFVRENFPVT